VVNHHYVAIICYETDFVHNYFQLFSIKCYDRHRPGQNARQDR